MGNSNTKESRPDDDGGIASGRRRGVDPPVGEGSRSSRNRAGRGDLGFLGLSNPSSGRDRNRQDAPFERRETRQEREARRLERERAARLKERERSVKEEHVDGGYLVTLGTYTGTEDFSKPVVRQLQIERKLAPFWRGLNDWSSNWAEHQLIAAARGLPIPAADETPDPELVPQPPPPLESSSSQNLQNLTVPMGPRTMSASSDRSGSGPSSPAPGKSTPFKPRAKALAAALSMGSRNASSTDLTPKEITLPSDPFVNGQPLEVFLYKDADDCPICFLSYPPYLNSTRCCDQPICSECFVQIKRADPHLPEHHPDGEARDPNEGLQPEDPPEMLISEPSACPYCQQPEFGVTYDPPPFRRGLSYATSTSNLASSTAMSSQSSLNSSVPPTSPTQTGRRRGHSLSATAPNVITTDKIRPDWATKLASARAHQARRAAAATALHTAAFLVGGGEQRTLLRPGRFSRRNTGSNGANSANNGRQSGNASDVGEGGESGTGENRERNARRTRMEELEDMMFMEAVRLSLAAEEERKRKEDKYYRKEAKKRLKEERKAQKKHDPYSGGTSGASGSSLSLGLGRRRGNSTTSNLRVEATVQGASQSSMGDSPTSLEHKDKDDPSSGKGKGVDRSPQDDSAEPAGSSAALPIPTGSSRGGSHLRQMSNASSVGSSIDSPSGSYSQGFTAPDGGPGRSSNISLGGANDDSERDTGSEPLFNFRSLAEMVGVNIEDGTSTREDGEQEDPTSPLRRPLSQVQEEDKEEFEAEHIEDGDAATTSEGLRGRVGSDVPTPELMITPETPAPEEGDSAQDKQLGHSHVTEHAAPITQ